ncbi:MAG TPA: T9SS type A sorting domain-containing protein [Aequorivita sp.]|nr:T9SS type A sorting domain-containing protein [Aequorivita sp.]
MMHIKLLLLLGIFFGSFAGQAQEYLQMIDAGTYKVQDVIESAETYFANRDKGRGTGYKPYKRWEYNALRLMNEDGYLPTLANNVAELERWNVYLNETASNRAVLQDNWVDLGPTYWNATSGWNPGVGRITGMDIEGGNENHIIIGAETGGVWRTTDGAQTWSHLTDYFSHLSVYSVVIHPDFPNTYFFGSSAGNIFKSTDSGATWSLLATIGNSIVNRILINPDNPDIMFAAAENVGLYRSVDGGQTWTKPISDNRGYDFEFKPGDLSVVYASGSGVYKSTDGGATFTTLSGFSNGPKMMAVSPANPEVLYVLEANNGRFGAMYTSTNSGGSFTKLNHGGLNFFGYSTTGNDNNGQAPRDMAIAINPTNADEVHIAGILTWRSMNAGVTFTCTSDWVPGNAASQNIGYCHADVDDLLFYGTNLYAVTDGGIFKATNTGTINTDYYEDLTTGLSIRQFYKIGISQTQDVLVSGGSQDNGTSLYTEAGGWKDWLGADGMETFVDKNNINVLYGTSQFGSMYRSMNGGNSYFNINGPGGSGNWVTPFEQDPSVTNTIYVGYNRVHKSTNSGATWTPISQSFGQNLDNLKIAASNNQVMYTSRSSFLFRTEDGGATDWIQTANPGGSRINSVAIHPTDPNRVAVAVGGGNKVMVTNDGGTTWENYSKNLPNFSALAVVWDDNGQDGLYLGMDYGIYYIDNTFSDWQPYSNLLPNVQVNELEINKTTNMLYAGTYGRGLWVSPVMGATAGVEDQVLANRLSIYPNPATSEIIIALPKSMHGEIRIFDMTGKLLFYKANSLIDKNQTVDVSTLSSGVYFVRLNTPEGMASKKLVIE